MKYRLIDNPRGGGFAVEVWNPHPRMYEIVKDLWKYPVWISDSRLIVVWNTQEERDIIMRILASIEANERAQDEEWFDFTEHPIVTRRDFRNILKELPLELLLLVKIWVEEEVSKRTPLSK